MKDLGEGATASDDANAAAARAVKSRAAVIGELERGESMDYEAVKQAAFAALVRVNEQRVAQGSPAIAAEGGLHIRLIAEAAFAQGLAAGGLQMSGTWAWACEQMLAGKRVRRHGALEKRVAELESKTETAPLVPDEPLEVVRLLRHCAAYFGARSELEWSRAVQELDAAIQLIEDLARGQKRQDASGTGGRDAYQAETDAASGPESFDESYRLAENPLCRALYWLDSFAQDLRDAQVNDQLAEVNATMEGLAAVLATGRESLGARASSDVGEGVQAPGPEPFELKRWEPTGYRWMNPDAHELSKSAHDHYASQLAPLLDRLRETERERDAELKPLTAERDELKARVEELETDAELVKDRAYMDELNALTRRQKARIAELETQLASQPGMRELSDEEIAAIHDAETSGDYDPHWEELSESGQRHALRCYRAVLAAARQSVQGAERYTFGGLVGRDGDLGILCVNNENSRQSFVVAENSKLPHGACKVIITAIPQTEESDDGE
ncbi:MAG: hypothetical protein R3337_00235 [Gammaproteobacteria bacterium]|nr:hypothetical protein [Gammaproteobacteria bacterium]